MKKSLRLFRFYLLAKCPSNKISPPNNPACISTNQKNKPSLISIFICHPLRYSLMLLLWPFLSNCVWLQRNSVKSRISCFSGSEHQRFLWKLFQVLLSKHDDQISKTRLWINFIRYLLDVWRRKANHLYNFLVEEQFIWFWLSIRGIVGIWVVFWLFSFACRYWRWLLYFDVQWNEDRHTGLASKTKNRLIIYFISTFCLADQGQEGVQGFHL